jgi:hygromycin-B 4-O-kinase
MKITTQDVEKFLHEHTNKKINEVCSIGNGEWSQAFFYVEENLQKVIRFSNIDEDFLRDQFAYKYSSPKLPIPEIEEIGKAFDRFFAISKKIEGEMIDNLDSKGIQIVVPKLMDLFEAMRLTDTSESKGFGGWNINGNGEKNSWKEYISYAIIDLPTRRIHGWKEKLIDRKQENDIFNLAYKELLSVIMFCPEERHIIHSDLLHFNVIVNNHKIVAVIDWGCAKYGDFLYDLAWFMFWQFYYPSMKGIDFKEEAKQYFLNIGVDLTHFEERLKCYQLHIGIESMIYCSFKENWKDVVMTAKRLVEVMK